jgi:hypothetical protein
LILDALRHQHYLRRRRNTAANLEVFRSFRYSFEGITFTSWFDTDGLVQSICVAALLSGLIFAGLMMRNRLPFGIAQQSQSYL